MGSCCGSPYTVAELLKTRLCTLWACITWDTWRWTQTWQTHSVSRPARQQSTAHAGSNWAYQWILAPMVSTKHSNLRRLCCYNLSMHTSCCAPETRVQISSARNEWRTGQMEGSCIKSDEKLHWPQAGSVRQWGWLCSSVTAAPPTPRQPSGQQSASQSWKNAATKINRYTHVMSTWQLCKHYIIFQF